MVKNDFIQNKYWDLHLDITLIKPKKLWKQYGVTVENTCM